MKLKKALIAVALAPLVANAADLNVSGSVSANGGHVYASQYLQSIQQASVGTYLQVGQQAYVGTYLQVGTYGAFGDFLQVGGPGYVPAAKSVQIGQYATTGSFNALVVGQYNVNQRKLSAANPNVTTPSPSAWNADDPIFEVGVGASAASKKNALTVYKDGTVTMSKAQGDILMGQFGN